MPPETPSLRGGVQTHGAERRLSRSEGFSDAVFSPASAEHTFGGDSNCSSSSMQDPEHFLIVHATAHLA